MSIDEGRPSAPNDTHLPDSVRQGLNPCPETAQISVHRRIRDHVHFDPEERNPDRDITPPRTYLIQRGVQPRGEAVKQSAMCFVYPPSGRCAGAIREGHMNLLHTQFTQRSLQQDPEMSFEQAVVGLLQRYPALRHASERDKGAIEVAPPQLYEAISEVCGGAEHCSERFASPLDRSPHMHTYWSAHEADQLFGANHEAYSCPWTGFSVAHPGTDPVVVVKAARWAITSAGEDQPPTCTFLLAPSTPGHPHMQLVGLEGSVTFLGLLKQSLPSPDLQEWRTDPDILTCRAPNPTRTMLLAIHNSAGKAECLSPERVTRLQQFVDMQAGTYLPPAPALAPKTPHALRRLGLGTQPLPRPRTSRLPTDRTPAREWPAPSIKLAIDPKAIAAYTDGSRINDPKTGASSIGAGVYMVYPARDEGSQAESSQRNPRVHRLNPTADQGYMNTITRAELCAIEGALNAASEESEELHIYTDSQVSIALIKKYITSPFYNAVAESKHSALLQRIAEAIHLRAEKGYHTRIFKVRSHTGVEGNEHADKVAGEAAKMERRHPGSAREQVTTPMARGSGPLPALKPQPREREPQEGRGNREQNPRSSTCPTWARQPELW